MNKLKVLDLFSGIGGFSYALEKTGGFETVAFCENDSNCRKVLKKHWPEVQIIPDINLLVSLTGNGSLFVADPEWGDFWPTGINSEGKEIDLICGGYPCTGHSAAGNKKGLENEASKLWFEYARIIKEVRPKYVIIENSPNLRNTGLGEVLKFFDAQGYSLEWQILSAYGVGAPHQRERIYLVAWRTDVAYCDPFRFWPTYNKKEKSKSEWWTERQFKRNPLFGQVGAYQPRTLRIDDGLSPEVHSANEERVKQLGNSIVTEIVYLIGKAILLNEEF